MAVYITDKNPLWKHPHSNKPAKHLVYKAKFEFIARGV